jgi:hypothetical protein
MSKDRNTLGYVQHKKDKCNRCGCKEDIYIRCELGYPLRKKVGWQLHKLTVHHMDRDSSNNDESNLETLCRLCHNEEHHFDYLFEREYLISRGYKL